MITITIGIGLPFGSTIPGGVVPPPHNDFILTESSGFVLLEDGSKIILESV